MSKPPDNTWSEPRPRTPAPRIDPVFIWPTPDKEDYIFFVERNGDLKTSQNWTYGEPYHDKVKYPRHKLVYVTPQTVDKWSRWYYASDRITQDDYNWTLTTGEQLIRTYLVPRHLYFERSVAEAAAVNPRVDNEFTFPEIGTADIRFVKYGFADDSVQEAPEQLASYYIIVQRRFIEPVTSELVWSDEFQRNIRVTREIIPAEIYPTPPTREAGKTIEIKQGNRFHDVRITQELLTEADESDPAYPYWKPPIPDYRDYRFPSKLDGIDLTWVWAYADSTGAPQSYSEDFYFDWKLIDPRPGPYSATILRAITDDPDSIKELYPLTQVPAPVRETIAVVYAWFHASQDGNSTAAVANEQQLPPSIHGAITVTEGGVEPTVDDRERVYTNEFAETPGYTEFVALTTATIGYETRELPFNLYEVTVIQIDISNLYGAASESDLSSFF
jgi:hypothetical protein